MNTLLATWSAVGPLVGVLLGGYLTTRIQRRQWVAENKKQEYRELLTALSQGVSEIFFSYNSKTKTPEELKDICYQVDRRVVAVIFDRIFIRDAVDTLNVQDEWGEAIADLRKDADVQKYLQRVYNLLQLVARVARGITQ